jgi:hypothetical protein
MTPASLFPRPSSRVPLPESSWSFLRRKRHRRHLTHAGAASHSIPVDFRFEVHRLSLTADLE